MNKNKSARPAPDAAALPSPPHAPRRARWVALLLLLAVALVAIWWIDRGVMLTNSDGPAAPRASAAQP